MNNPSTELELRAAIHALEYKENGNRRGWAQKRIHEMTHNEKTTYKKWSVLVSRLAEMIIPLHEAGTSYHHRKMIFHRPDLSEDVDMTDGFMGGIPEHSVHLRGME